MISNILLTEQKEVLQSLEALKLKGFADELYEQFTSPSIYSDLCYEQKLKRCIEAQIETQANNKFRRLISNSKIKNRIYLNQFKPNLDRGLDRDTLLKLKDGDFIDNGVNIIITGPTGTGKTALACATALEAMRKGKSALFFRMSELSTIIEAKDKISLSRFIDRLSRIKLLIIDDYGLTKIHDGVVSVLNEIADIRYGVGSTILTSQIKKKNLKDVIDPSPIRDALADRLFRCTDWEINLKGTSFRGSSEEILR